jgi:hypothetical protein
MTFISKRAEILDSVGAGMYYTGIVICGIFALAGIVYAVMRSRRTKATLTLFKAFKQLVGKRYQVYWLIIACKVPLSSPSLMTCILSRRDHIASCSGTVVYAKRCCCYNPISTRVTMYGPPSQSDIR